MRHDRKASLLQKRLCLGLATKRLMRAAMMQRNLSARAFHRTQSVKLACTIADLAEALHAAQPAKNNDGIIHANTIIISVT